MGCCFSRSSILEDSSIKAYLRVKRFVVIKGYSSLENNISSGLLYTDGYCLYYETTCGERRACCLCCRYSVPLSSIKAVAVTEDLPEILVLHGQGCPFTTGPYLQLTTEIGVIIVAAHDMGSFPQTIDHLRSDTMNTPTLPTFKYLRIPD